MKKRSRKKLIHEGRYVAEVEVEVLTADHEWSPYLSQEGCIQARRRKRSTPARRHRVGDGSRQGIYAIAGNHLSDAANKPPGELDSSCPVMSI